MSLENPLAESNACTVYEIEPSIGKSSLLRTFIASTAETRSICNDPFILGIDYTRGLQSCLTELFRLAQSEGIIALEEQRTNVFNILRGGLNFGIREALADAFDWNEHSSSFISAQRARDEQNPENWHITEDSYEKIYFPEQCALVLGDVVATGTTFAHSLRVIERAAEQHGASIASIVFVTIGGDAVERHIAALSEKIKAKNPSFEGASIFYLEGRFEIAATESPLTIKCTGSDLIRSQGSVLAPAFVESQYESSSFPLERCAIYDAGSRAFWSPGYLDELKEYWQENLALANSGITFEALLEERFPELDASRFKNSDLREICEQQIKRCEGEVSRRARASGLSSQIQASRVLPQSAHSERGDYPRVDRNQ
jgi:hypoxanthine-guanine phosphoribosyltransferase